MTTPNQSWSPSYWRPEKHGQAWERVKEALRRDYEQTRNDWSLGGKELNQDLTDTVKQAVGTERIPPPAMPNGTNPKQNWSEVELALRYGFGAHEQYESTLKQWDHALESKLSSEWDESQTGRKFEEVKPFVRKGWDSKQ